MLESRARFKVGGTLVTNQFRILSLHVPYTNLKIKLYKPTTLLHLFKIWGCYSEGWDADLLGLYAV